MGDSSPITFSDIEITKNIDNKIMRDLRRYYVEGGTYFFTVVTSNRRGILCLPQSRDALKKAIIQVRKKYPFEILAWVLLPDHLHCIWTLPLDDCDFSLRWRLIKRNYSFLMKDVLSVSKSDSQKKKQESGFWQRRFWEHVIKDENDLAKHFDYVHFNPVKHGLVENLYDWKWSTYHRYLKMGYYNREQIVKDYKDIGHE